MDQASVEINGQHLRVLDGLGVDGENIAVEHDEIGAFAGFKAAGRPVLLHGEGRIDGIGVDRGL